MDVKTALSFDEGKGFQPLHVRFLNIDTQEIFCLPLDHDIPHNDSLNVEKVFYVNKRFNVSNQCYYDLSMITDLPSSYSISKAAKIWMNSAHCRLLQEFNSRYQRVLQNGYITCRKFILKPVFV